MKKKMALLAGLLVGMATMTASANPYAIYSEIESGSLQERTGSLFQSEETADGVSVWGRYLGGKVRQNSGTHTLFAPSTIKATYSGIQVGMDKKINEKVRIGGFVGYTDYNVDYVTNGDADIHSTHVGIYGIYKKPETGFYLDGTFKVGSLKQNQNFRWDPQTYPVMGQTLNNDVHLNDSDRSSNWSLSVGAGQKVYLNDKEQKKEGFYIEPRANVMVGRVSGSSYKDTFTNTVNSFMGSIPVNGELEVEYGNTDVGLLNLGTLIGYEVKSGKNPVNVYGKVSFIRDFGDEMTMSGKGTATAMGMPVTIAQSVETNQKNHWWVFGLGVSSQIKERHNLYLDLETTAGSDIDKNWQLSGGYRFSW